MPVTELTAQQLRRALWAVTELAELDELAAFPARVAALVRDLIPADHAGYNAIDLAARRAVVVADPSDSVFADGPDVLACYGRQNRLIAHHASTDDHRALRLSDFMSRRELQATELYDYVYRLIPLEYQLAVQLPSPRRGLGRPSELVGISLGRVRRDFSAADQRLLEAMRPHLAATLTRLHEVALARAIVQSADGDGSVLILLDSDGTIAWASPVAEREHDLLIGDRAPEQLRGVPADGAVALTLRGRRVSATAVRGAYPGLDAVRVTPAAGTADLAALRDMGLTPRQAEVMALAAAGRTPIQIARMLGLSVRSVEKNFERIYARLGVANRTQAVVRVLQAHEQDGRHLPRQRQPPPGTVVTAGQASATSAARDNGSPGQVP